VWKKFVAAFGTIIGVVGFVLLIAQDQSTLRIASPYGADDPAFPALAGALAGSAVTTGNTFEMFVNGEQIFPAMLAAIDNARTRISLETYIYEPGEIGSKFDAALERAARRGVTVNTVFDAMGSPDVKKTTAPKLKAAGANVGLFNAPEWYTLEEVNYRSHRKILVLDGSVGFTGGAGISDNWIGKVEEGKHWRDTQFRIAGPAARLLEAGFTENFIESSDADKRPVTPQLGHPQPDPGARDQTIVVWSSPTGGGNGLKDLYLLSLAAARRTLDIASPYFLLDESTGYALDRAIERGVKVRVLVEGDVTDAKPVKYSSRHAYEQLLQKGIEIYEYQPTLMHAKTIVADGAWCMFGSANFDNRSLELNDELNVATQDRVLAARITAQFNEDLRLARKLELTRWRQRPALEKVREWMWAHFNEVF
jgi:cardiolipin synthase